MAKANPMMINGKLWDRDKVMAYVCDQIATTSLGLNDILSDAVNDMPIRVTVMGWLAATNDYSDMYARAKERQADYMAEEILSIADDSTNDYMARGKGDDEIEVLNAEHVQRSRLRIDSRKWLMAKLIPRKYGDRIQQDINGSITLGIKEKRFDGTIEGDDES